MTEKDEQYQREFDEIVSSSASINRKVVAIGELFHKTVDRLKGAGKTEAEIAELTGVDTVELRAQVAKARETRAAMQEQSIDRLKGQGRSNAEIAVRTILDPPLITEDQTIWFPGIYSGRQGAYAQKVADVSLVDLVKLVQKRAQQDGEWAIANGHVGENNENEPTMRKMMAWVSDPVNIEQCVGHILKEKMETERTVDFVCRDLANGSKYVANG